MSKSATRSEMADLHALLASTLASEIRGGEATPALLNVARSFLRDSGIEVSSDHPTAPVADLTEVFDEFAVAGMPDFKN